MTSAGNTLSRLLSRVDKAAFQQVDNSPLIVFRVVFGLLLCYHVLSQLFSGYVNEVFIKPPFTFNFIGFDFLQPIPGRGMYYYFGAMAFLALCIAAGAFYRVAIILFTLLWTILYLMQKSHYNNHYYFILLLCWLMIFMPANRYFSIDVQRKAVNKSVSCSQWISWLFIGQVAIVYFYAAIAKFNHDWLSGLVTKILFHRFDGNNSIVRIYHHHAFHLFIAYTGILFDLLIVPLLLWRKTRPPAVVLACVFHVFNSFAFGIGIFPYLSIAMMVFFVKPVTVSRWLFKRRSLRDVQPEQGPQRHESQWLAYTCLFYLLIQLALPLRPFFYPGKTAWSEEGHRMSWRMMARNKRGKVHFKVVYPATGKTWIINPAQHFSAADVSWIATQPDFIWQYAQWLKKDFAGRGIKNVEIYAISSVSLNGRRPQPLVDTTINLAAVTWHPFRHSSWIMPFK